MPVPVADPLATGLVRPVKELHESHTLLDQPPRENAVSGEGSLQRIRCIVGSVELQDVVRFGGKIADLGNAELHLRGKLVAGDSRREFCVARKTILVAIVERLQKVSGGSIRFLIDGVGSREVSNWLRRVEVRPLKCRRQKTRTPVVDTGLRRAARVGDRDISRQVAVLTAEAVRHPRSHAGKSVEREAGRHEILARSVRVCFSGHRMDKADVVRHPANLRDEFRNHLAGLAARFEFPRALCEIALAALKRDQLFRSRHRLTVTLDELGLVVERVEVAAGSGTEDDNYVLRFRREVGIARRVRARRVNRWPDRCPLRGVCGEEFFFSKQTGQRDPAQTGREVGEETSTIEQLASGKFGSHRSVANQGMNRNSFEFSRARHRAGQP